MPKRFNVTGVCRPQVHYMINLNARLQEIKQLVDAGEYFSINRARQYGKTTTLRALAKYLQQDYLVISMDFQLFSHSDFETETAFVTAFSRELLLAVPDSTDSKANALKQIELLSEENGEEKKLAILFAYLSDWCRESRQPLVLMIDEVDSATNNQVFLDFLAQLRGYFNRRDIRPTFQSVILAGVYDIRNLKQKIRPDADHKTNSSWNIAADFTVNMALMFGFVRIEYGNRR